MNNKYLRVKRSVTVDNTHFKKKRIRIKYKKTVPMMASVSGAFAGYNCGIVAGAGECALHHSCFADYEPRSDAPSLL